MSKKFLNRTVAAILMMAIISTMFLGGAVSAATDATATYTVHDCSVVTAGSTKSSAYVTFKSETPFSIVRFQVSAGDPTTKKSVTLSSAEFVEGTMADGTSAIEPKVSYELATEDDPAAVMAEIINEKDIANRNYYTLITIKLNFLGEVNPWNKYFVTLGKIDMAAVGESTIFTVTDATPENTINYIHAHTYSSYYVTGEDPVQKDYYDIGEVYCGYCKETQVQLIPDDAQRGTESPDATTTIRGISSNVIVNAINVSYNADGTINIQAHVSSPYYNLRLIVCPTNGYKYHQFGGNANEEGQGKEDISIVANPVKSTYAGNGLPSNAKMFTFTGIPAKDIGEELLFTVLGDTAETGGTLYYGPTLSYSLADYCYDVIKGGENVVGKEEGDDALYAALLDYGAAAQVYEGEEATANADLADEYKGAYKAVNLSVEDEIKTKEEDIDPDCKVHGTALILRANASLKFYFALNGDYRNNENVVITLKRGDTVLKSLRASEMQHADSSGRYYAYTLDVGPLNLSTPITVTISDTSNAEAGNIFEGTYSVEGYALKAAAAAEEDIDKYESLANVTKALVYYGKKLIDRYGA